MKRKTQAANYIYPLPVVLIGADDSAGKPNFMVVAYVAPLSHEPPVISISMGKGHYTNACIEESKLLSVNIPSSGMIDAVDYAGSFSAVDTDKSQLFRVERGELGTPLVASCPISLECRLVQILEFDHDKAYVCRIENSYVDEDVMVEGLPDITRVDPLCLPMHDFKYHRLGECLGRVWSLGPAYTPPVGGV